MNSNLEPPPSKNRRVLYSLLAITFVSIIVIQDDRDLSSYGRRRRKVIKDHIEDDPQFGVPSKPLHDHNMWVTLESNQKDVSFVNVTEGFKEHPHLGARDKNGTFGYIYDEKALREDPPGLGLTDQQVKSLCSIHDENWELLTKKIRVDFEGHEKREREAMSGKKRTKIFCVVYTLDKFHHRIPSIRRTWGPRCDGFMVASNKTDESLGAVDIPHQGPETYDNIWQQARSMWSYVYDNYYDKYDWFQFGGDDYYLLVENLRLYLESEEIQLASNGGFQLPKGDEKEQTPLYLGRRARTKSALREISSHGGAGYTLNKAALKALVIDAIPACSLHKVMAWEDVLVGRCFGGDRIYPYDTQNEEGEERYMPYEPAQHFVPESRTKWFTYTSNDKHALGKVASHAVSFHDVAPGLMSRMHALLYGHCGAVEAL